MIFSINKLLLIESNYLANKVTLLFVSLVSICAYWNAYLSTGRNEISYLDLSSGESVSLRKGHLSEPDSPIDCIRVSNLKQYFIVVFKDKPLEYWDLFTLMPLRILTAPHPITTAVEWAPANITGKLKAQHAQKKPGEGETYQQEVYLMADVDGILYQVRG